MLTTCSSTSVNCQQQTTVSSPTGAQTVYTFQLNNGAWPISVVQKDSSGNALSTTSNTWDFSQSCVLVGCYGNNFIRLLTQTSTVYAPGASLTKQVTYSYDSPQAGNKTAIKEWRYSNSGSFSSVPDRATYITYLTTGTNNINRPSNVTLCNSSGNDSSCPGGGSRVSQTLYYYDVYGSGLTPKSGIAHHDDQNFGSGYTTGRGNVTSEQQWVNGSTYLPATSAATRTYDTTGQLLSETDPAGNITQYGYGDSFFTDNGNDTTPTPFSASPSTNAYLTSVTDTIGTRSKGYYWGSGKVAVATDYNNVSTYSHYQDGLDRQTEELDPVGWTLATYTSATQSDMYAAVGDTSASTGCTSCLQTETVLDEWGRTVSSLLRKGPLGQINVDSTYDNAGQLQSQSHPYAGSSDPNHVFETFGYDPLGRRLSTTHPDGQILRAAFGSDIGSLGGVTSQQGSTTTYGFGYPQVSEDEAAHQHQEWTDGFGRIIEVDEPSTSTGNLATTTVGIGNGGGQESQSFDPCQPHSSCPQTAWNSGDVYLTIGGYTESAHYSQTQNSFTAASDVATALATAFNSDPNSPVIAAASGSSITFTAKGPGASGNLAFSSSATFYNQSCPPYNPCFGGPVYAVSPTSGSLSGGSGGIDSSPLYTNYIYDAGDRLTQVVQGVQTRTFSYDGLGRKIFETTPEAGTVTYTYPSPGSGMCSGDPSNVCTRTDARGVVSTYTYDGANRLTGVAYTIPSGHNIAAMPNTTCTTVPNGTLANVCYYYDQGGSSVFAMGHLTKLTDPTGSETTTYYNDGHVKQISKVINGQTFTIGYQYDAGGDVTQITYPSGRAVYQTYNAIGQLCQISPTAGGCGGSGYYASIPVTNSYATNGYDAPGHLLRFTYGNGVSAAFGYSAQRAQLSTLQYALGSQTYFNLGYWYQQDSTSCPNGAAQNNGTIQCITDSKSSGRTVNYTYDPLGRLSTAKTNGSTAYPQWGLSEGYDRFGNRLSQTVTAGSGPSSNLSFGPNGPNSTTTNQPNGYTFDASGNMTIEPVTPSNTMTYDGENRMTAFGGNGGAANYTYDGNGLRVVKSVQGGTTTVSVFSGSSVIAEYDNGAVPGSPSREYIYNPAGGETTGLLAMIPKYGAMIYYHQDHLSMRLTTYGSGSSSGRIATDEGHYPFGEPWYQTGATNNWVFTRYDRDSESGFDYALARYYDSRTGTFCSADPLAGSPSDPQSWNRYPYGRNDPIDMTDPSGKSWWSSLLMDVGVAAAAYFAPAIAPSFFGTTTTTTAAATTGSMWGGTSMTIVETGQSSSAFFMSMTVTSSTVSGTGLALGAGAIAAGATPPQMPKAVTPTTPQSPKQNCPPVPPHPKGADIDANIRDTQAKYAADPTGTGARLWWENQVKSGGVWDYKLQSADQSTYDDFGNFNYGATGAALDLSFNSLKAGAVYARLKRNPWKQLKDNGFSNPSHKNDMIRQGMQYKQNNCGKF